MQKKICFANIADGSNLKGLQAVLSEHHAKKLTTGTSVQFRGKLVESKGTEQTKELQVEDMKIYGQCDAATYPLQKKHHTPEFLREISHFRSRGNTGSALLRTRNATVMAFHNFFQERDFLNVQTPIITTSDFYLTVSSQLHLEILSSSASKVYTFGPTFRAERSQTSRHLAEFWMLEAEMAFIDSLDEMLTFVENLLQSIINRVIETCPAEIHHFAKYLNPTLTSRLSMTVNSPFVRMTYKDALDALNSSGQTFTFPTKWGSAIQSEHEKYLANVYCRRPVFITDYPRHLKPFYMRARDDDDSIVSCVDLIVPHGGELIGGSLREERYEVLEKQIKEAGLSAEEYSWYLDLRKYGTVPHCGFGVGFDRFLQYLTGVENIRDVTAFPRAYGYCKY
ncbi:1315_t:CDS:2 [Paraglomus brasilianum]|uniref:asparagine--tRNA ligase n=1 Tax=Paraglomus brasilianum TaxID=144538 RepID=A0A9N8Z2N0_9GLOM|nr:1315_t:CDS:2 [Paraglomus brasilianum]